MNRRLKGALDRLSTLLVCIAAAFVLWAHVEARWLKPSEAERVQDVESLGLRLDTSKLRHIRGDGDVVLIEFTDYECPFCGRHAREVAPALRDFVIDSKRLRHVLFNFPLDQIHPRARPAAIAAECAGRQGRLWEMHDHLFSGEMKLSQHDLLNGGREVGLDMEAFSRCLDGGAEWQVARDIEEGQRLGVNSTPTFFVGRMSEDGSHVRLTRRIRGVLGLAEMTKTLALATDEGVQPNFFARLWRSKS